MDLINAVRHIRCELRKFVFKSEIPIFGCLTVPNVSISKGFTYTLFDTNNHLPPSGGTANTTVSTLHVFNGTTFDDIALGSHTIASVDDAGVVSLNNTGITSLLAAMETNKPASISNGVADIYLDPVTNKIYVGYKDYTNTSIGGGFIRVDINSDNPVYSSSSQNFLASSTLSKDFTWNGSVYTDGTNTYKSIKDIKKIYPNVQTKCN